MASIVVFAKELAAIATRAGTRWVDDACYRLGAALAFYAVFSIFPLALLAVTVVGFLLGDDDSVRQKVLAWFARASTAEFRVLLDQTLQNLQTHRTGRGIAGIIGMVSLLLGASGVFSELEAALDTVWRVKSPPSGAFWPTVLRAVQGKALAFAVVGGTAVALLVSLAVTTALHAIGAVTSRFYGLSWLWWAAEAAASVGLLTLVFAALFRMVPRAPVLWRDVLGGALVTSLLFVALKSLFAWYLANLGGYAAYGAVGAVLGLLMWIYVACLVVLYGAEFSHAYAERFGSLAPGRRSRGTRRAPRRRPIERSDGAGTPARSPPQRTCPR